MGKEVTVAAKPFLKWVGGKARLMPQLSPYIPLDYNNYYEPFLGGGAFYFALPGDHDAVLNDINYHLIAAYEHIRDHVEFVISDLKILEKKYHELDEPEQKEFFLKCRVDYNKLKDSSIKKTALLIYLNKTCFNGMYRENSKGEFNVPFGKHRTPMICDEINLRKVSEKLIKAKFYSGPYTDILKKAKKGDFVYLDPPYFPLSSSSSFTSYNSEGFGKSDQERLRDAFEELDNRGCFAIMSNSSSREIREYYKQYKPIEVLAARAINSVGSKRGNVIELVIVNKTLQKALGFGLRVK